MTQGTQNTIVATNLPSFPWNQGDQLDAIPLNNIIIQLQNQINYLTNQVNFLIQTDNQSNLGVSMTVDWGGNTEVTAGPYVITGSSPYGFTVLQMECFAGTNGGSFLVTLLDDGVPFAGLTNVLVSGPTQFFVMAPLGTQVNTGDQLSLSVSAVTGTPLNAWIGINGTTNTVTQVFQGTAVGSASGSSMAMATSAYTFYGQAIMTSAGTSTAQGVGVGVTDAVATAFGTNSFANMHGIFVMIGSAAALASGISTATAVGSSTVTTPTFIMDDPNFGQLDINPLA